MKRFKIEKDLELEELLGKCKKKGLKFGLALGSGSARGLAHVGVIQVLEAHNIPIDMIAGTSIGSVIGSLYASGASIEQLMEAALSMKKSKTLALLDPALPHSGFIKGHRAEEIIKAIALKDKTFDDLNMPFAAVATVIKNGAKAVINKGKVIDAVRASISIPGIFTPVKYQDYFLVDGGLVDPVPVDATKDLGADIVIAVSLAKIRSRTITLDMSQAENNKTVEKNKSEDSIIELKSMIQQKIEEAKSTLRAPRIFEIITQTIDIMESKITEKSLEGTDIIIVPFGLKHIRDFDFDKAEQLIKGGIIATLHKIPEIKAVIKTKLKQESERTGK
ncbi:MAG: patatin-like phospholipase family protein [Candidatus Caldatribacteriota bacterium]|nr:patatin-like phospholipase family protein [Candidatus Caldatribacteriota bacterium]